MKPGSMLSEGFRPRFVYAVMAVAGAAFGLLLPSPGWSGAAEGTAACDRELRKTLEAIEAWRVEHNGAYPAHISELKNARLLPLSGGICPRILAESTNAPLSHPLQSSRGRGGDPAGTYEYELAAVRRSDVDRPYLPDGAPDYTRRDLKLELLRRKFAEQVPILRCGGHGDEAPPEFRTGKERVWRNLTTTGMVYWSGDYWELNWVSDVPYCCRDANVMFGLKGPPFFTEKRPELPTALDLRPWNSAFGDHPWWWTFPMFERRSSRDPGRPRQTAPDLRAFFRGLHGRVMQVGGEEWWIDGLVQLQGRILPKQEQVYEGLTRQSFVWGRTNVVVNRRMTGASWLQATLWPVEPGETVGWLRWNYNDGTDAKVPMVYGRNTARFWADDQRANSEAGFPEPAWRHRETAGEVGKDRWVRLYRQDWRNPRPEVEVRSLDFFSEPASVAAPLLIAVNVRP